MGVECSMKESVFSKSRPMRILDYGICKIPSLFSCYFCPFKTCWNAPCHSSDGLNPERFGFLPLMLHLVFGLADQDARKRAKCCGQCNWWPARSPMCLTPFSVSSAKYENKYAQVPQAQQMAFSPFPCQLDQPKKTQTAAVQMHFAYLGKVLQLFQNCKLGPCHPDTHSHSIPWKTSAQTTIFSP